MSRAFCLALTLLLAAPALSGCFGLTEDPGEPVQETGLDAGPCAVGPEYVNSSCNGGPPGPGEPTFTLAQPLLQVINATGIAVASAFPGDALTFQAQFAPSDRVNESAITSYVWNLGDGTVLTGKKVSHAYDLPGRKAVRLTVEDAFGRRVQANATVGVSALAYFRDTLLVGDQGAQQQKPRDYQEHVLEVPGNATRLLLLLTWDPNSYYGAASIPHGMNKLRLEVLDASGAPLPLEGSAPSTLEAPVPGKYVARVIGEQGALIPYVLTVQTDFAETPA